jgi:hypothetical protein
MPIIQMPGGAVEEVKSKELWWMRNAFDEEWKGAVMLRLESDRLYSIEHLDDLARKFKDDKTPIAMFTPPEGKLKVLVNADNVARIEPPNPIIYHEKAGSVLRFTRKVKVPVRETEDEANAKLKAAQKEAHTA